ncbi:cytochrome P450 [Mycena polygramma]|nr:cytochrome P450 [Mycena polygramma]
MISQLLFPIAATAVCYGLLYLTRSIYQGLTYPLRNVRGPRNPSFIFGNFKEIQNDRQQTAKWRDEFGSTFRFKSLFSMNILYTSDVKALSHIIANAPIYQTPDFEKRARKAVLGNGILTVEMEDHKRQATFGTSQIRALTEIFVEKAVKLRDIWASQLSQKNDALAPIDVYAWIRRMTLDVIGEAGFDYQFNALTTTEDSNELSHAFTELNHSPNMKRNTLVRAVLGRVPFLKYLPLRGQDVAVNAHKQMFSVAGRIVSDSIRALGGEKSVGDKKDVLSVLLRANLDTNLPANQRMSDNEVVSQIPTFLIAGHETTSSATAWALNALSLNPDMQIKLREELFTLSTENPTMDELNSLPYLESVVREVLRVYAPVTFLDRVALEDDVLPLSKPYIDNTGEAHDTLHIPKGQVIHMPILSVNTDPEIWGDDAAEFKPQRWTNVPGAASGIPSAWANLFTFFAGPSNCIGFKFSLVEFKALLFTLVRAFEFEPAVPAGGIVPTSAGLQSPMLSAEPEKGTSLPLLLKPYGL